MNSKRSILLGLFFLVTLFVLGYYTLFLTNFSLFKKQPTIVVHFSHTNGLREGDSVLVAGMRWGRVKSLVYDPKAPLEKRITVIGALNEELELRQGFTITIQDQTLLGGRNVSIDPGPAEGAVIAAGTELIGDVAQNPLDALGKLVKDSQASVEKIVDNIEHITGDVRGGKGPLGRLISDQQMAQDLADAVANASKTLTSIQTLSTNLLLGKGTVGQLLTNDELYQELHTAAARLNAMLENASEVTKSLRQGSGLAGRLLNDEEWAAEFGKAVANVDRVLARVEQGEGTLGMLLHDDTIARNVRTISDRLVAGEGTLGKLLTKDDIYENLRSTSEDFATVTGAVRNGRGSLGRLIMDADLYDQVKAALLTVQRALEEYREAAPITTFTAVFFGAF